MTKKARTSTENVLINIQNELSHYYLQKIKEFTQPHPYLQKQINRHREYFTSVPLREVSDSSLQKAVNQHQVICVGDYHAFSPSQNEFLEHIQAAYKQGKPLVVILESIPSEANPLIQQFLDGHISTGELMSEIEFENIWGFDSYSTEKILIYCKTHKIPVYGMNLSVNGSKNTVDVFQKRENHFLTIMDEILQRYPKHKLFVLVGNLHLMPGNLPQLWASEHPNTSLLCVHQNCDEVYWRYNSESPHIGRACFIVDDHNYVVINSHPWMKHHSYWHVLEKSIEYDAISTEEHLEESQFRQHEQFVKLLKQLMHLLKIEVPIPDFHVYGELDLALPLLIKDSKKLNQKEKDIYLSLCKRKIAFYAPQLNLIYFPIHTSNVMVEVCLKMLHSVSKAWHFHFRGLEANFYSWVVFEAHVFMVSLLMNPSRRAPSHQKVAQTIIPPNLQDTYLPLFKKTSWRQSDWHQLAELHGKLASEPHRQVLLTQWIGRQWGRRWFEFYVNNPRSNILNEGGPEDPHDLALSKAFLLKTLSKIPFRNKMR